jgi:hypothetical protein
MPLLTDSIALAISVFLAALWFAAFLSSNSLFLSNSASLDCPITVNQLYQRIPSVLLVLGSFDTKLYRVAEPLLLIRDTSLH